MPRYDYSCRCGETFEAYAGYDDEYMACQACNRMARRQGVYRDQFISCETGPKGGQKVEPPREEKSYRKEYAAFSEASQEIDYAYSRVDDPKVKPPNYYKMGQARAEAFTARHRGKRKVTD